MGCGASSLAQPDSESTEPSSQTHASVPNDNPSDGETKPASAVEVAQSADSDSIANSQGAEAPEAASESTVPDSQKLQIIDGLTTLERDTLAHALKNNKLFEAKQRLSKELREFQVNEDDPLLTSTMRECEQAMAGLLHSPVLEDAISRSQQTVRQLMSQGKDEEAIAVQHMQELMERISRPPLIRSNTASMWVGDWEPAPAIQ